jgi:hypothetical protein
MQQTDFTENEWKIQDGFVIVTFNRVIEKGATPQVGLEKDPSTTQVAVLIKAMNRDFMAISDMMKVSHLKSRKRFRENYVTPALKDEAIERKYPDQPNHPKQQYRLTKRAQKCREKNT